MHSPPRFLIFFVAFVASASALRSAAAAQASVRENGGVVYMNFGGRQSEQFTVTLAKRNEGIFKSAGLTLKALTGRVVEVRGWVEERSGPAIEVIRPEQIEIVN